MSGAEYFETGSKKARQGRGMARRSLALIHVMRGIDLLREVLSQWGAR